MRVDILSTKRIVQELLNCAEFIQTSTRQIVNMVEVQLPRTDDPVALVQKLIPLHDERSRCQARALELAAELSERIDDVHGEDLREIAVSLSSGIASLPADFTA